MVLVFFFKQKTAYEMRISDWSSDVCSSDLEDLQQRVVDLGDVGEGFGRVEAGALVADEDDAAGVDHVVRRIEDAALAQRLAVARLGKLVVGGAGDDLRLDLGQRGVVDGGAERAGRVDIDSGGGDGIRRHDVGVELAPGAVEAVRRDV